MTARDTTLDDIAESIADLSTMMAHELGSVRQEMTDGFAAVRQEMGANYREHRAAQDETNRRLEHLEALSETNANDVKELYSMIAELQRDIRRLNKDERQRLADLEAFALQVAEQTGIPFIRKSKRPS